MARNNRNVVPESRNRLNQMKFEIAAEFGLYGMGNGGAMDTEFGSELGTLGAGSMRTPYLGHYTSRENGSVGGEITKRLVMQAEQSLYK